MIYQYDLLQYDWLNRQAIIQKW